jgi:GNAT superfamily N-acetyltransferase
MTILLATENFAGVRDEIEPLMRQHYEEIALYKDRIPLAPDWGRYRHMEETQSLAVYTAREDGALIGYSVFLLSYHLHYVHTLVAANDVLFLDRDHRKGSTGIKLIKHSEQELKKLGVERIMWHVKFDHDFRAILHRLGYADEEAIVGKLV